MRTRRQFIRTLSALAALPLLARAQARRDLVVYKSAGCGCCGEWEEHMRAAGFRVESHAVADIAGVKRKLRVPEALSSCHTATVSGYVIEGHVPAADVHRLLRERPAVIGLAVPGMPRGAPGMESAGKAPYETVAFQSGGSWVFQRHGR